LATQAGQVRKKHCFYEKHGSCTLFPAIEPRQDSDWRKSISGEQRKNTFSENLPADQACALAKRFEYYFTPKSASWLNMIEIEYSVLTHQYLNRRIPTMKQLGREVYAKIHPDNIIFQIT
jgi:hypothetical protein